MAKERERKIVWCTPLTTSVAHHFQPKCKVTTNNNHPKCKAKVVAYSRWFPTRGLTFESCEPVLVLMYNKAPISTNIVSYWCFDARDNRKIEITSKKSHLEKFKVVTGRGGWLWGGCTVYNLNNLQASSLVSRLAGSEQYKRCSGGFYSCISW